MQKRHFTRVEFSECASVKHEDQVFFGDIKNLSLQGLFLKTDHEVPLNAAVEITVFQPFDSSFFFSANVVRREETGFGMQIKGIDVPSFVHLRDAVAKQCKGQDMTNEMFKMVSCIQ